MSIVCSKLHEIYDIHPLSTCHADTLSLTWYHADTLSNMMSCFLMSRQQAHMTTSNLQFSHIYICLKCLIVLLDILWIPLANTCTNWNRFAVFLRWNRRLLTRNRHENWHVCWFYFNMDKSSEYTLLSNTSNLYPTCSNIILQIYDIQQSIIRNGPAF